jgi:hypothetical protein
MIKVGSRSTSSAENQVLLKKIKKSLDIFIVKEEIGH